VVVTHAHPDHVMAVPLFREMFPSVAVLASESAAKTLAVEKAVSFFCKMDDMLTSTLIDAGELTEEQRRPPLKENMIPVDRALREGDTFEVDEGVSFQVVETPGHSECSLSFYAPEGRILIISDATGYFMPEHDCWWPNYFADYGDYVNSIERLAGLEAEVLCLSHNAVIRGGEDVAAYFSRALNTTQEYHKRIVDLAGSGKSARDIAEQLGTEIHQKTPLFPVDFFQKNCQLLVKISLKHEGVEAE
jgi:glyoxylase-like metal-dependent hydrolase (beta-lactamase superfamily II)